MATCPDESRVRRYKDLNEFLDKNGWGSGLIVFEKSLDSFDLDRAVPQINRAQKMGYEVRFFKPLITAMFRKEWGLLKTTDERDATVIYRIATETKTPLSPWRPSQKTDEYKEKFQLLGATLMMLRREDCYTGTGKRYRKVKKQEQICSELGLSLPKWSDLTENQKKVLCNKDTKYSIPILITVWEAAKVALNRREFLSLVGLHQNGHGSIMRSNLYHHGLSRHKESKSGKRKASGITPKEWSKEIRWLYHQCKAIFLGQTHKGEDEKSIPQCNGQGMFLTAPPDKQMDLFW